MDPCVSPGHWTTETTDGQDGGNPKEPTTKAQERSEVIHRTGGLVQEIRTKLRLLRGSPTNLLSKTLMNPIPWTDDCEKAFTTLKDKKCSSLVLQSPDFSQRFQVQVDTSATGIGAFLAQGSAGEERPVVYLSRKLLLRETRYSVVEKEGLAIRWSLDSLRYYLLGREFDIETDHQAITWIQSMKDHNARVTRWYLALQPYCFKIRHRPGRLNVVANYLSRFPASTWLGEGESDVIKRWSINLSVSECAVKFFIYI